MAVKVNGFGQETGQFRNTGTDVQASPATAQFSLKRLRYLDAKPLAGPSLRPPKLIAPFVTINGTESLEIKLIEDAGGNLSE